MENVKVGNAAKQLGISCRELRAMLEDGRMIHQDAQLRWVTTRRGRDMETVVDHEGFFWNQGTCRHQMYTVLKITPKGMRWLRALLDRKAA